MLLLALLPTHHVRDDQERAEQKEEEEVRSRMAQMAQREAAHACSAKDLHERIEDFDARMHAWQQGSAAQREQAEKVGFSLCGLSDCSLTLILDTESMGI